MAANIKQHQQNANGRTAPKNNANLKENPFPFLRYFSFAQKQLFHVFLLDNFLSQFVCCLTLSSFMVFQHQSFQKSETCFHLLQTDIKTHIFMPPVPQNFGTEKSW